GTFAARQHNQAAKTPVGQRLQTGLGFQRYLMERYRSSSALAAWFISDGAPGGEYSMGHGRAMRSWDASPAGLAGWRHWLRDECHWSLADLGKRWYGDPGHFAKWEEVALPDRNEFFGELGSDCLRLTNGWRWKNQKSAEGPLPSAAPNWIPVEPAPSQQMAFLPRSGFNYFATTLDATAWLATQKKDSEVWLVFGFIGTSPVWLNGQALELPKDTASQEGSFAIRITDLLKPGVNKLQIAVKYVNCFQNCGQLAGPVFLTTHEPKRFPYLGRQANARYCDLVNWQAWAMSDYHRKAINLARKLDPEHSLILSGGMGELFDYMTELCTDYHISNEITWRECNYSPWMSGSGLAGGYYGTGEESWIAKGVALDRSFGFSMFDADSAHTLYPAVENYESREKEDGWFTRHRRQINLFGKYLREQPQVALLYSGQSRRYVPVGYTDIGLDVLPETHFDNVYVSEAGLKRGLATPYPVMFDIGNSFMEPDTVAAIDKYVEQGGRFIALSNTALHSGVDPNTYPLSKASGFKIAEARSGKIRFASYLPFFKGWENKEFDAHGMALVGVSANDKSTIPLARWSDGSVAIGYRKVGQGAVITLGCLLWKDGKDGSGTWKNKTDLQRGFFTQLLADCGVTRNADASTPDIWARKMVTKNGLQSWLVAFNAKEVNRQADVWMAVDGKPDQVIDLDTNQSVPFIYENNGVTVKNLSFAPHDVRVLAVRRATLAGGLPVWWYEKTRYWQRTPAELEAAKMTLPAFNQVHDESVLPLNSWRFTTDPDQALVKEGKWMAPSFDDAAWVSKSVGPWNVLDPKLKDYQGVGLYRVTFTVPPAWKGRRVLLNLYNFDDPIVYDTGEFFVNGVHVASYQAHYWSQTYNYDVTERVHPGE
ncbi:MAG: hypothetical protein WCI73_13300, partial [Phycisphaerae bacterium]